MKFAAFTKITLAASLVIAPAALLAQQATPAAAPAAAPITGQTINQRKDNQQDRIAQGVKSGQLTAGETSHLERQEAGINKEERGMRQQDNGHLTRQDKRTINRQQNVESRRIYKDKHNAAKR